MHIIFKRRRGRKRLLNKDIKVAQRALNVIHGLCLAEQDLVMTDHQKLELIYKYSHVGIGSCENPHEDWQKELVKDEKALVKMGIISAV